MAKPILLLKVPRDTSYDILEKAHAEMEKKFPDYYVFIANHDSDFSDVQVFYDKDFTETTANELKEILLSEIQKIHPNK